MAKKKAVGKKKVAPRKKAAPRGKATRTRRTTSSTGSSTGILRPAEFATLVKQQAALSLGSVLDHMCLTADGQHALGGIPQGCTMALTGPLGKGKTRTALVGMARAAYRGLRVGLVVSEEKFQGDNGRDDLCSRLTKLGMAATGLDEAQFRDSVLSNIRVLEIPAHEGVSWDEFLPRYRSLVEDEAAELVVIDSLTLLDPSHSDAAGHLATLRSYNHGQSVTCLCVSQLRDLEDLESLNHVADAVFVIEPMLLKTKETASLWGGRVDGRIDVIRTVRCLTAPEFPHPIRLQRDAVTGEFQIHAAQPGIYAVPSFAPDAK